MVTVASVLSQGRSVCVAKSIMAEKSANTTVPDARYKWYITRWNIDRNSNPELHTCIEILRDRVQKISSFRLLHIEESLVERARRYK
jgi:hypothetical protein